MQDFTIFGFTISPEKYEHLLRIPQEKLFSWLEAGLNILPNFVVAVITLLMFYPFAKLAKFLAGKIMRKNRENIAIHEMYKNIVFLVVFFIGLFSALEILNLEKTVASLLAGAGVIGLALGFAFQEIASNFVSGIMISSRKLFHVGDNIEIQGKRGVVQNIMLRTTTLQSPQGQMIIIPNKLLITDTITNFSTLRERKVEIVVGVSYHDDLKKIVGIVQQALNGTPNMIVEKGIEVYFTTFNQSSIDCKVGFWVEYPGNNNYDKAIHHAIVQIKDAFDKNGITIPYPTQTVDMSLANKQSK